MQNPANLTGKIRNASLQTANFVLAAILTPVFDNIDLYGVLRDGETMHRFMAVTHGRGNKGLLQQTTF